MFGEDQRMFAETLRSLLAQTCTGADLRRTMATPSGHDAARWSKLVEMGLLGALVPEEAGGLGLCEAHLVLAAEEVGYAALPEPLIEQAGVVAPLLAALPGDAAADALRRLMQGEIVALAHPVQPWTADAQGAVTVLLVDGGALHLAPRDAVRLEALTSVDPTRRLSRVAGAHQAGTRVAEGADALRLLALAQERGAVFAAAQGLGLGQRCIDLAAAYAKERVQFGKPIGSYQAVKHLLATAQTRLEFARPVVYAAAASVAGDTPHARARTSHAKLAALAAADLAARTAVQVHGAMGYSWEVDVHLYLKRALALAGAWGDESFHRRRVMAHVLEGPLGPDLTFGPPSAQGAAA